MNTLGLTYAGLGGDNKFLQVNLDSTWLLPVTERTHFSLRGRYGDARGLFGKDLPLYKRYYVGGPTTVRGLRNVGERDDHGFYIGGKRRLIFNVSYIFPLVDELRLQGEIFYDAGTAFDDVLKLRESAGAGIRWMSPIGPMKLDWAHNLHPEEYEPDSRWEFSIGTFF